MMNLRFGNAESEHAQSICDLVNLAYRGAQGWTRETHLVAGERSQLAEVQGYLQNPETQLLLAWDKCELVACICVEQKNSTAYLGYFAVHPAYQQRGVGKRVLAYAERFAWEQLTLAELAMQVIAQRKALIAWYQRRGYQLTDQVMPYPVHLPVGVPRQALSLVQLTKSLAHSLPPDVTPMAAPVTKRSNNCFT